MEKPRYIWNALFNQGAFLVTVGLALLMSPFVVSRLGDESYGLWTLVVAVTGYYSFVDLGIRSAVGQYVTRHMASGDWDRLGKTIRTSMLVLTLVAAAVLSISVAVALLFPRFFKVDPGSWPAVRLAILMAGGGMAMKFPAGVFQAIVTGGHRWDMYSARSILVRLSNAAAVVVLLTLDMGLVGVAAATLGSQLLEGALMYHAARKVAPRARFGFGFDGPAFAEIKSYGIFAFVITICEQIILYSASFIIGFHLGPVAVTYFTIGANLIPYMDNMVLSLSGQLRPIAIAYDAGNKGDAIQAMFLKGSRYVIAFVCLIFVNIWVNGGGFLGAWMGEKYLAGTPFHSSADVLMVLAVAHLGFNMSTVGRQIMYAQRRNNLLAIMVAVEAACNLALSLILVRPFGILGVAFGTLVPMVFFHGLVLPWVVARQIGVPVRRYWSGAVLPNLAVLAAVGASGAFIRDLLPLHGWPLVFVSAAIASCLHLLAAFLLIADAGVRAKLFAKAGLGLGPGAGRG